MEIAATATISLIAGYLIGMYVMFRDARRQFEKLSRDTIARLDQIEDEYTFLTEQLKQLPIGEQGNILLSNPDYHVNAGGGTAGGGHAR